MQPGERFPGGDPYPLDPATALFPIGATCSIVKLDDQALIVVNFVSSEHELTQIAVTPEQWDQLTKSVRRVEARNPGWRRR